MIASNFYQSSTAASSRLQTTCRGPRAFQSRAATRCRASRQERVIMAASTGEFLGRQQVPMLGIGLAALGRPGYINLGHDGDLSSKSVEDMREHCWQVLDAAWRLGIRYYDAARSYGKAEEFLSGWLSSRGVAGGEVLVGSKWGYYYTADWQIDTGGKPHEVKEHTYPNLVKQTSETSGHLGSHLALYQIHSATLDSGVLSSSEVLGELAHIKEEKGWRIGLSLSGVQQAETLRQAMQVSTPSGQPLFDSVQATWNLLEQSAGPALLEAQQRGLSVIIKEGMANGRLTSRNCRPGFEARMRALQDTAQQLGTTVDALALAAIMAQPFKPMVLSGATTVAQLESNAQALQLVGRLEGEVLQQLMAAMVQPAEEYWAERAQLAWN